MSSPDSTDPEREQSAMDRIGPWIALIAAIGLTASGEYELAQMVGFPTAIAWALPTAIDVYVVQAMRRHRDVAAALILMIATNGLLHLANAHIVGVSRHATGPAGHPTYSTQWWLIILVAAIAPVIVWRVHRIREDTTAPATQEAARSIPVIAPPAADGSDKTPPAHTDNTAPAEPTTTPVLPPEPVDNTATTGGDNTTTSSDSTDRQNPPTSGDTEPAAKAAKKAVRKRATGRSALSAKAPRRSLTEWVEIASPVFHVEFARLRRQPTANEFATAIEAAGLGRVSDSTAKNIRTEILDRSELPALD